MNGTSPSRRTRSQTLQGQGTLGTDRSLPALLSPSVFDSPFQKLMKSLADLMIPQTAGDFLFEAVTPPGLGKPARLAVKGVANKVQRPLAKALQPQLPFNPTGEVHDWVQQLRRKLNIPSQTKVQEEIERHEYLAELARKPLR
jgi:hypothetical protein|tara:strand:+ start:77 stop:505 length:429 start_codon:yes stop_codon:yes gene_type:complete